MADGQPTKRRRWLRRAGEAPTPTSRVCPSCHQAGPARLVPGEVCASCAAQQAWADADAAGVLVVDQASIAAALERRQAARTPWWQRPLVFVPALVSLAVAGGAAWALAAHLAAHPIAPLRVILDDLHAAARLALWTGIGALIVGIVLLVRTRRRRHFRRGPLLVAHALAIIAGASSAAIGGASLLGDRPYRAAHITMPARESLDISTAVDRVMAATVVLVAPDGEGDARRAALGSGAIVASDAHSAWIVTCSHVAMPYAAVGSWRKPEDAQPVWVQLSDGREGKGFVRWAAPPPIDIALVELAIADPPAPVQIARDAQRLPLGTDVMFVPNPYRDGWLVHRGSLVRKDTHQSPAGTYALLVTDLPIIPGDSGSGLFDTRGQLIGLNTWFKVERGLAEGISLPSEAMTVLADAVEHGELDKLDQLHTLIKE